MLTMAAFIGRVVVGGVFLYAGAAKVRRQRQFARAIRTYEIGGERVVATVVTLLPLLEIGVGILLLVGLSIGFAALSAGVLLTVFTVATARQLLRGRAVDCGCFGATGMHRPSWVSVARNLALLAAAVVVVTRPITAAGLDQIVLGQPAQMSSTSALALAEGVTLTLLGATITRFARRLSRVAVHPGFAGGKPR